ncbi:tetratricopeptide repeat protein [Desulfosarcina sp.]|nr:tetratricopeptide repeat protein [Desulfosarcina sp.]
MGCLLFHKWDGCTCEKCGEARDQDHDWDYCKCRKCGRVREQGEIHSKDAEAYFKEGVSCFKKGNYDQAISHYDRALEIDPQYAEAYFNKAIIYEKRGRNKDAVEAYREFLHYAHGGTQWIPIIGVAVESIIEIERIKINDDSIMRLRRFLEKYKRGYNTPGGFDKSDMKDYIRCIFEVASLKSEKAIIALKEVEANCCYAEIALTVGSVLKNLGQKTIVR